MSICNPDSIPVTILLPCLLPPYFDARQCKWTASRTVAVCLFFLRHMHWSDTNDFFPLHKQPTLLEKVEYGRIIPGPSKGCQMVFKGCQSTIP